MRLLNVHSFKFTDFREGRQPKYVIASHRWVEGEEATLLDVRDGKNKETSGYKKVDDFAKYVRQHVPGVEWLWVDTVCIDKTNAAELSKSLNLMFDWYCNAVLCVAYLSDVKSAEDKNEFQRSEWFKRGWTLQELLGSRLLIFVTDTWQVIGNKGASTYLDCGTVSGAGLEEDIATITNIPERVLRNYADSAKFSVEEKLEWMEGRATTEPEYMSYALFGILGVTPGANYGEKDKGARQRLLAAVKYRQRVAAQEAERFREIVEWISPPDPWTNYHSARQLHESGTGSWLLESDTYQNWKTSSTRHLWLYGKAGCGKTVLCSTAVRDVKDHCENQPNAGMGVFYFTFSDSRKQRLADMLRSLVAQLSWKGSALSMLQEAFDQPNRSALGVDELETILRACFKAYDEVFLLVDALDECPEESDSRHIMFDCLLRLSQKTQNVKIFGTSRELLDIGQSMGKLGALPLFAASRIVNKDIRQYIGKQITHDPRLSRLDQDTKALVEDTLTEKADGMFRWTYCQLQELKKLKATRPKFVKAALQNLPVTLDGTYERMLGNIEGMFRDDAFTLLQWLAYAKSPPSLGELAEATIIDPANDTLREDERGSIEYTLHVLSGLVTIVKEGYDSVIDCGDTSFTICHPKAHVADQPGTTILSGIDMNTRVRLAHFSVKEYLESKRILGSKVPEFRLDSDLGHRLLAQSCLIYLTHYSRSRKKSSIKKDLVRFPLLRYAADYWFFHSSLQNCEEVSREVSLLTSEDAMHDWLRLSPPDGKPDICGHSQTMGSGLYYASFTGLDSVVSQLLEKGADLNAHGGNYCTALAAASFQGNKEIVQLLIGGGAEVENDTCPESTALAYACDRGYTEIVQLLLDAGASARGKGILQRCVLIEASFRRHNEIVKLLLDAGADVNAMDGKTSALNYASSEGYMDTVQMLLDAGADANAVRRDGHQTIAPLSQASSLAGNTEIVKILLDAGAHVNWLRQDGHRSEAPLATASCTGDKDIVQILLDAGAHVDLRPSNGTTALQMASAEGHYMVVQMLLDARADVNLADAKGQTALQMASEEGHHMVVQMLLDARADVNLADAKGQTALQMASEEGHHMVVQMLLDARADVNLADAKGQTALQMASEEGHHMVVQMLLDARADVNLADAKGQTALQMALEECHHMVVHKLVDAGADVNLADAKGQTALQIAFRRGYVKIFKKLLDAGADVNAPPESGRYSSSMLESATRGGHDRIVKMLLDAGVDVNAQTGPYSQMALQEASEKDHERLVKMPLDAGADLNNSGIRALWLAQSQGHTQIVQMLLDAGVKSDDIVS